MEALFSEFVELANWGRKVAEKSLFEYEHYFTDYYWADKKEQYLILMKEYPELFRRVSLKELASYLNLTLQSLSRIRVSIKYINYRMVTFLSDRTLNFAEKLSGYETVYYFTYCHCF